MVSAAGVPVRDPRPGAVRGTVQGDLVGLALGGPVVLGGVEDPVLGDLGQPVQEAGLVPHLEGVEVFHRRQEGVLDEVHRVHVPAAAGSPSAGG